MALTRLTGYYPPSMPQKRITLTRRQIRFANYLVSRGRFGADFSEVIRRWVDAGIDDFIRREFMSEDDGGLLDEIADESDPNL